ncbi:MAG: GAF domain-containing protein [Anaerolineales bacterium]|jgi:PAS domain S-box-containing protein|nr:GAF domain-containing protein [Anaerolineales bacterium]
MSDNKKIRNRLNQIFTDIADPENQEAEPKPKKKSRKAASEPVHAETVQSPKINLHTGRLTLPETGSVTTTVLTEIGADQISTLSVPFSSGDTWNNIEIVDEKERKWSSDDQALVRDVVDQLTLALQNAKLFQQTEKQNSNLEILNEMGRELATQLAVEQVLETTFKYTNKLIDTKSFFIAILDNEAETLRFPIVSIGGTRIEYADRKLGTGLTDYVLRTRKPVLLNGDVTAQMKDLGVEFVAVGNAHPAASWLGVPLAIGNKTLGAIVVQSTEIPYLYNEQDRDVLVAVASQTAIALQNAQLFQQTETQREDLEVLNEMAREISSKLSIEDVSQSVYKYAGRLMDVSDFFIGIYHPEVEEISFTSVYFNGEPSPLYKTELGNGLTAKVLHDKLPLLMPDRVSERAKEIGVDILLIGDDSIPLCWLGVPMIFGQEVLGAIVVQSDKTPNLYSNRHKDLLVAMASQVSVALQNARLFNETQQRASELSVLNDIMRAISAEIDLNKIFEVAYEKVHALIKTDVFIIGLYDEASDIVAYPFTMDENVRYESEDSKLDPKNYVGQVIASGKPVLELRSAETLRAKKASSLMGNTSRASASLLYVPLLQGQKTLGVLSVQSYETNAYAEKDVQLLENIANQLTVAIQNASLYQNIQISETRFRDVALASADWVWEIDLQGRYSYCSDKIFDVLGYKPEEVYGKSPVELMPSYEAQRVAPLMTAILRNRERMVDFENRNLTRAGREVILITNGLPILDEQENMIGYRGVNKDVTSQRLNQAVEDVIAEITQVGVTTDNLSDALALIYESILQIVPTKNLYFALHDKQENIISYPFKADEKTSAPWRSGPPVRNLTHYVIRNDRSVFATEADINKLCEEGEIVLVGDVASQWIGIPLKTKEVIGMFATQTYDDNFILTNDHFEVLKRLAPQIATVVEKIRAEALLSASEAELRALFNSMNDVIVVFNDEGRYVRIAPTNPSRLIMPAEDLLGKTVYEAVPPELQPVFMDAIQRGLQTSEVIQIEYPLNIGGQKFWFDASVSRLSQNQVFWVARDITERKEAEEALRRQNEYLSTATEVGRLITSTLDLPTLFERTVNLLRASFSYYHVSIFIVEENGFNAVLREATGMAGDEMKNRQHSLAVGSKSIIGYVTGNGKTLVVNNTAIDPIHRPNPLLPETRAEAGIPLKIGSRIIGALDIQAREVGAFLDADIAILETLADQISVALDNARSYELAQKAVNEMRELDRIKSQFLANMSHELRTPLNSIIGFSRVILKGIDGPINDQQQQDLSAIYNSGQHLLNLINDVLDLSKIEAGKMELAFEEINITDTINSVMSTAIGLVKDKPVRLEKELAPNLPTVRGDAMRLRQVFLNLLGNAAKFTEEGKITIEAAPHVSSTGVQEVLVSVHDTGPGISAEDQAKLFQAFSQVDSSPTRKSGGTGLGLSISHRLIELHGGRIGAHSVVGQGSTFYFTIPVYQQENLTRQPGEKVILCIDDDPQIINLYERYLKPQGYHVVPLVNPANAKDTIKRLQPYAVTLDIMMPQIDGWQVLTDLKNDPETRDIPIIVCSIVEEEEKGFSMGASDYLVKPILQDDLLAALNRLNGDGTIHEVLIIDDSPDDLRLIERIISEKDAYRPILAQGGEKGWELIQAKKPHAIILDLVMPDLDGFEILERLKTSPELLDIPVLVISGAELSDEQKQKLDNLGKQMLKKGMLSQDELFNNLEKALKRLAVK